MSGLLGDLANDERVGAMMDRLEVKDFPANSIIVRQGDAAASFFIIVEGEVAMAQTGSENAAREICRLGPAQHFGEVGLLAGSPAQATIRCLDRSVRVLVMAREEFLSMVADVDLLSSDIALLARRRYLAQSLRAAMPQLNSSELASSADDLKLDKVAAGAVIVRQGDAADTFHIVAAGAVEVVLEEAHGAERILGRLGPGEYFGEMGLLMRRPRTATVRAAAEGAEILTMHREAFERIVSNSRSTHDEILLRLLERVNGLLNTDGNNTNGDQA